MGPVLLFFLSGIKYVIAVGALLANQSRPWYFNMMIAMLGGISGVFTFTYLGSYISDYFSKFSFFKIKNSKLRRFIKIKNSYGLIGLAVLSPVLFSIPIGCILSSYFEHNKNKILKYQVASVVLWSLVLFSLKGFNIIK